MIDGDDVHDFIETHRTLIVIILAAVLLVLVLILVLGVSSGSTAENDRKIIQQQRQLAAFKLDELFLPLEPLGIPGVILSRPQGQTWKSEDALRWYLVPDSNERQSLRSISQRQINEILESVP